MLKKGGNSRIRIARQNDYDARRYNLRHRYITYQPGDKVLASPSTSTGKRKLLSLKTKRAILDEVRQNVKKSAIARKFDNAQSTLSTTIKNGSKIDAVLDADVGSRDRKRIRCPTYGDVEAALYKWFVDARSKNIPLSGPIILAKAKDLGFALGHENFQPGNRWLQRFKDRHNITCKNFVGEAASVDQASLQQWMAKHRNRILAYSDKDIYNADETGLFFQLLPWNTLAAKTDKCMGAKDGKNGVTVLICVNMDSSDNRDQLVIGKAKKPRGFAKVLSMPVTYVNNKKAWMTRDIFGKWLADFDKEMVRKKRKVLMLRDNCSAHHVNAHLSAVEVLFLPPYTTAKLQPIHQGVIANFKVHYRLRVIERLLIDVHTADSVAGMKVPLVKATFFASGAYRDVKHLIIAHCFEKAGFSRSSSAEAASAGDEVTAIDVAATADAAAATACLEQLWDSASDLNLVPAGLSRMYFVFADEDLVATEDFTTEEVAGSVMEETMADSVSDRECDDASCAPKPVTYAAAIAAVDTLRIHLRSPQFDQIFDSLLQKLQVVPTPVLLQACPWRGGCGEESLVHVGRTVS
nr:tigger transposable element-derived protein 6-like [Dermacentor andersoni]